MLRHDACMRRLREHFGVPSAGGTAARVLWGAGAATGYGRAAHLLLGERALHLLLRLRAPRHRAARNVAVLQRRGALEEACTRRRWHGRREGIAHTCPGCMRCGGSRADVGCPARGPRGHGLPEGSGRGRPRAPHAASTRARCATGGHGRGERRAFGVVVQGVFAAGLRGGGEVDALAEVEAARATAAASAAAEQLAQITRAALRAHAVLAEEVAPRARACAAACARGAPHRRPPRRGRARCCHAADAAQTITNCLTRVAKGAAEGQRARSRRWRRLRSSARLRTLASTSHQTRKDDLCRATRVSAGLQAAPLRASCALPLRTRRHPRSPRHACQGQLSPCSALKRLQR